jgi:putative mRNA 3-end processing factor
MEGNRTLADLGFVPVRHRTSGGNFKPHFSLTFSSGGECRKFGVDTTRSGKKDDQYFLITHAHTDHYGKSAMLSERAIASDKTAVTLEMRHDQHFKGRTFRVGETIDVDGVQVRTYHTGHSIGATAFFWENDLGVKVLVTGDVKDFSGLPKCDLLVTEATYGDPHDPGCIFRDDHDSFEAALGHRRVGFGAYAFGKAQRAVSMARSFGFDDTIAMDRNSLILTRLLLGDDAGDLIGLNGVDHAPDGAGHRLSITSPWTLNNLPFGTKKFVLTGQKHYEHPTICISDHLDFNGLRDMVYAIDPEFTLVYHPDGGGNATAFSGFLRRNGKPSCTLADLAGGDDMPF